MTGQRRFWFAWIVMALLFCLPSQADHPNILIIMADDMGFGDVQALNPDSNIPTPHLNQLAEDGMSFLDAHSPSAVCTPTRYTLLTGRYSWRTPMKRGVLGGYSKPMLVKRHPTIATMLQQAGYQTAAVGKWHLGMEMPLLKEDANVRQWKGDPGIDFGGVITDSPIHHGFDRYFGVSASLDMAPYVYIRDDRFTMKPSQQQPGRPFPHFIRPGPKAEDFVIDLVLDRLVQEATTVIRQWAPADQPFFVYVPFTAPHKPTQPKEAFRGVTELGEYGDFVAQVDDAVGRILSAIESTGEADNTLVVFTSDNGSYMYRYDDPDRKDHTDDDTIQGYRADSHTANGPWRGTKADIYEAGHHVPFFVRWPGEVPAGSTSSATICHADLFATIAEIVGHELGSVSLEADDSFSFLSAARGMAFERPAPVIHQSGSGMLAIREGPWKLIAGNGSGGRQQPRGKAWQKPYQLFNLSSDPGEQNDLAEEQSAKVKELTQLLNDLRKTGSRAYVTGRAYHDRP